MKVDLEMMDLFEELEETVKNASTNPFSHKCSIDKQYVLQLLADIRSLIPEEVTQAVWVNKERHKIINKAKQEAEEIIEQANKEASRIEEECNNNM